MLEAQRLSSIDQLYFKQSSSLVYVQTSLGSANQLENKKSIQILAINSDAFFGFGVGVKDKRFFSIRSFINWYLDLIYIHKKKLVKF